MCNLRIGLDDHKELIDKLIEGLDVPQEVVFVGMDGLPYQAAFTESGALLQGYKDAIKDGLIDGEGKEVKEFVSLGEGIPLVMLDISFFVWALEETKMDIRVLKSLIYHELVHVDQYLRGDFRTHGMEVVWKGVNMKVHDMDSLDEYFESPWEIEAYTKQAEFLGMSHEELLERIKGNEFF